MKYFTPRLFADLNSSDERVADKAEREWEEGRTEYQEHVKQIAAELPKSLREFCRSTSLHDAIVESGEPLIDAVWLMSLADSKRKRSWASLPVRRNGIRFWLHYADPVEPPEIIHPVESPVFRQDMVLWLYDEVDVVKKGVFSHSILLSNGDVLIFRFKDFALSMEPIVVSAG